MPGMTADPDRTARIEAALSNAIATVLHDDEDQIVTRWAIALESVAADGARGMWVLGSEGTEAQDVIGLFGYGLDRQRAEIVREVMEEER